MIEYEYSFKVKDEKPFEDFCRRKKYKKIQEVFQTRILYKSYTKILSRVTINEKENETEVFFDLKEENEPKDHLKKSQGITNIKVTEENKGFVNSILRMYKYSKGEELKRKRSIYEKNNVRFKIDNYLYPKMKVVVIEGDIIGVDKVNKEIKHLCEKYKEEDL